MKHILIIATLSILLWGCNQSEETEITVTICVQDSCVDVNKNKISKNIYELYYLYDSGECNKILIPHAIIKNINDFQNSQEFEFDGGVIATAEKFVDTYSTEDMQKNREAYFKNKILINEKILLSNKKIDELSFNAILKDKKIECIFYNTNENDSINIFNKLYPVYNSSKEVRSIIEEQYCKKNIDKFIVFYNLSLNFADTTNIEQLPKDENSRVDTVIKYKNNVIYKDTLIIYRDKTKKKEEVNSTKLNNSIIDEYENKLSTIKLLISQRNQKDTTELKRELQLCERLFEGAKKTNNLLDFTKNKINNLYEKLKNK